MHKKMTFYEMTFTKAELQSLSRPIFDFMVSSSMAANDVATFQRLAIQNNHEKSSSELIRNCQTLAFTVIVRSLAAKIVEYVYLIEHFKRLLMRHEFKGREEFAAKADEFLKIKEPPEYQAAKLLRDRVTHHYTGAGHPSNLKPHSDETTFSFYLHRAIGNSLAPFAEEIGTFGLLASEQTNIGFDAIIYWVATVSGDITKFQHNTMAIIVKTFFPSETLVKRDVPVERRFIGNTDSRSPLFIAVGNEEL